MLNYKKQIVIPLVIASMMLTMALCGIFFAAYNLIESNIHEEKIEKIRYQILSLQSALVKAEAGQRGYMLTNNSSFVQTYQTGKDGIASAMSQLSDMLSDFPQLKPAFLKVAHLSDIKLQTMESSIQIQSSSGAYAPHLNSVKMGLNVTRQIDALLQSVDAKLYAEKTAIHLQTQRTLKQVVWGTVVLVMMIVLFMFFGYRKTIHLSEVAADSKSAAVGLSHDAYHDMLTQLPNRRFFETHLKRMIALGKRNHQSFALLYLDLDGFKEINDKYGHDAGDEALIHATERFTSALRESDFLARLGGDEFAVIIDQYSGAKELKGLSGRILRYLQSSFIAGGHTCQLGVSIGISCYPENGSDMETLIGAADSAMYRAKRTGKNRAVFAAN